MDLHPLRGNLFENMVVSDFMKHGTNRAREDLLYFYRDKSQREVDMMRVLPDNRVEAYEIKSARTFQHEFFNNLNYVKSVLPDRIVSTGVVYDGNQENHKTDNGFYNFRHIFAES